MSFIIKRDNSTSYVYLDIDSSGMSLTLVPRDMAHEFATYADADRFIRDRLFERKARIKYIVEKK